MKPDAALARLRDPEDGSLAELSGLIADHVVATPLSELVDAPVLARHLCQGLRAVVAEATAEAHVVRRVDAVRDRLRAERRPARTWIVDEVDGPLRDLLRKPLVPSEELTFRIINHEALRSLLREVLTSTLSRFGQGVRALDKGVLGGLGGRVARRGRGLLGGVGAAAEGLVGTVREELEGAFETRVKEYVGGATEEAVHAIARWLADPAHAASLAAMRVSVLDVLLDIPVGDLVQEADELGTADVVHTAWQALEAAARRDGIEQDVTAAIDEAVTLWGDETLGTLLDELGAAATFRQAVVELLTPRLRAFTAEDGFEAWWRRLHS